MPDTAPGTGSQQFIRSEGWALARDGDVAVLRRHIDATELRLAGEDVAPIVTLLESLVGRPRAESSLQADWRGSGPGDTWSLFKEYRVVRRYHPAAPLALRGAGALYETACSVLEGRGWRTPPLLVGAPRWRHARPRDGEVAILGCGPGLVAALVDTLPCPRCLLLRRLGRLATQAMDQDALAADTRPQDAVLRRALLAEMLCEMQTRPLLPGQGLIAHLDEGIARTTAIAHPDCEQCAARPDAELADAHSDQQILALLDDPRPQTAKPEHWDRLVDPHVGPLLLNIEEGPPGYYPFDGPFIWGSVRLTRHVQSRTWAVSTWGGVYSMRAEPQRTRLIAISEGVERLAARGARPDCWQRMVGDSRERGYSRALDLITRTPRLVPFEKVAVGLPRRLLLSGALSGAPSGADRPTEPFYSGCASHTLLAQAVLNGTLELIGRDAFMISWYRRRALARLSWPETPDHEVHTLSRYLRSRDCHLELFDMTLDAPVRALLLRVTSRRHVGNWPEHGALLVAGVGFTAMAALAHACRLACGQYVSLALHPHPDKDPLDAQAVERIAQTSPSWALTARYLDPRNRTAHDFLGTGNRTFESLGGPAPGSIPEQLATLKDWLAADSQDWLVIRLTDASARLAGFEVVRVIIPGLVPLVPARSDVPFELARMQRAWPDATCATMNADPHPLY